MCVDIGGGGSHFLERGVHRGITKRGVHVNPPGYEPERAKDSCPACVLWTVVPREAEGM